MIFWPSISSSLYSLHDSSKFTFFTLTRNAGQATDLEVFVDNVQQEPTTAYGVSGTTLTFTAAPSTGTNNIYVVHQAKAVGTISVPDDYKSNAQTISGARTFNGGITMGGMRLQRL